MKGHRDGFKFYDLFSLRYLLQVKLTRAWYCLLYLLLSLHCYYPCTRRHEVSALFTSGMYLFSSFFIPQAGYFGTIAFHQKLEATPTCKYLGCLSSPHNQLKMSINTFTFNRLQHSFLEISCRLNMHNNIAIILRDCETTRNWVFLLTMNHPDGRTRNVYAAKISAVIHVESITRLIRKLVLWSVISYVAI